MTRFMPSTAPSKAWTPNARHNPPCCRSLPAAAPTADRVSTGAAALMAPQLQSRISTSLTGVTREENQVRGREARIRRVSLTSPLIANLRGRSLGCCISSLRS